METKQSEEPDEKFLSRLLQESEGGSEYKTRELGSTTILVIFGGATIILLLIYFILALRKYLIEQRERQTGKSNQCNIQKDYDQFKRLKMMEMAKREKAEEKRESKLRVSHSFLDKS
jgi:hypothetical protein